MARPRKPTALKVLEGDRKERLNKNEPLPTKGLGKPPEWLDDLGRSAWVRVTVLLDDMGVSARPDSEALGLYCESYSMWRKASNAVRLEGLTVLHQLSTEERKVVKVHPLIAVANEAHRQMARLLSQFGMTPAARAGIHLEVAGASEDSFLAYFSGDTEAQKARKAKS